MANLFAPSLQGDGIRFEFFHHLWSKNRSEDKERIKLNGDKQVLNSDVQVRLPDTVIFRLGQPLEWYFTNKRGGHTSILKKRKRNVNVEKIEEVFLRKNRSTKKGRLDSKNDIIAYFIASGECSSRNRQISYSKRADCHNLDNDSSEVNTHEDEMHDNSCDIEYFNEEGLRQFLCVERKNQTGILQRFIDPAGAGTHNSQIRAICTPKMCVLERRKTKQDLNDSRFGLYERAVTFEGPEVYSCSLPIRGTALPGQLRKICNKVLNDISQASITVKKKLDRKEDKRMVLNLKVDCKERIWVLYSSSIRSLPGTSKFISDIPSDESLIRIGPKGPLNIQNVITFSPSIKLCQNANHDPSIVISNKKTYDSCPSCAEIDVGDNFQPVPYKTIISHFEQVMKTSRVSPSWPPHAEIVKSAGGVGFGTACASDGNNKDIAIPPVIRHLHPRLTLDGYRQYRSDPLFLHRKCEVCESCFLAYAQLVSTSFQITRPIQMDTELERLKFSAGDDAPGTNRYMSTAAAKSENNMDRRGTREKVASSFGDLFLDCPSLPPAIVNPPLVKLESDPKKFMPLPYEVIESPHQPLMHLLNMQKTLQKRKPKAKKVPKKAQNPYAAPIKFVDSPKSLKMRKKSGKGGNNRKESGSFSSPHASVEEIINEIKVGKQQANQTMPSITYEKEIDSLGIELLSSVATQLQACASKVT